METRLGLRDADTLAERVQAAEIARIERHPFYVGGVARATLETGVARSIVQPWIDCLRHGEVHAWPPSPRAGEPAAKGSRNVPFQAMAGVRVRRDTFLHETHVELLFLCDPVRARDGDLAFRVLHPILSRADELSASLRAKDWFSTPAAEYAEAIDILRNGPAGLFVDSLVLRGEVATACARLKDRGLDATSARAFLTARGLVTRPLSREADIEAVVELQAREFSRNPRFGWFLARSGVLHDLRSTLRAQLGEPDRKDVHLIVETREGAFAGVIGASWKHTPPWGTQAGSTILLAEEHQGRGLSRPLYALLYAQLDEAGVRLVLGNTSQPGVLRIARDTGRQLDAVCLRRGPDPFPADHFAAFLPDRRQ